MKPATYTYSTDEDSSLGRGAIRVFAVWLLYVELFGMSGSAYLMSQNFGRAVIGWFVALIVSAGYVWYGVQLIEANGNGPRPEKVK